MLQIGAEFLWCFLVMLVGAVIACCGSIVYVLERVSPQKAWIATVYIWVWFFIASTVCCSFVMVVTASPIGYKAVALWLLLFMLISSIIVSWYYYVFYQDLISLASQLPNGEFKQVSCMADLLDCLFAIETSLCGVCSGGAYLYYAFLVERSVKNIAWCCLIGILIFMLHIASGAFLQVPRRPPVNSQ